jgi:hypothetical protein
MWGAGIGLGVYLATKAAVGVGAIGKDDDQPKPTARVGAPAQGTGVNVRVSGRNISNTNLQEVTDAITNATNARQVDINQRDDTRTLDMNWIRELFSNAL